MPMNEHALVVDGSPLSYTIPSSRPGKRTYYNDSFTRQLIKNTKKEYRPRFDFWSGSTPIIIADFDEHNLPESFTTWDQFRDHLAERFHGVGFVTPSSSGYAKVFFKVAMPTGFQMNVRIAHATLRDHFHDTNWVFDLTPAACQYSFVDQKIYSLFDGGRVLDGLKPVSPLSPEQGEKEERKAWTVYELPDEALAVLEEAFKSSTIRSPQVKEIMWFLVRWVSSSPGRALESIGIAQMAVIASARQTLGAEFLQKNVSLAISALKAIGLLEVVDNQFFIGRRSKLYRAIGDLEKICAALAEKHSKDEFELPTSVEDGIWHHILLDVAPHFFRQGRNYKGYAAWFESMDGHDLGDRAEQMNAIWDWFENHWK